MKRSLILPSPVIFFMVLFGMVAVFLGQDASWDFKNYHWYNAYAFLHHRMGWDIAPAQLQSYFNPLLDVLNYNIIQHSFTPKVAEFILGTLHGIAVYFLVRITVLVIKIEPPVLRFSCIALAVLIGVTSVASYSQIGTTFNEPLVAAFVMASLFLAALVITGNYSERKQGYWWMASAFVLGLGFGLKLTAISYVVGFFVAFLFYNKMSWQKIKVIFFAGIFLCLGFLVLDGFWLWTLYGKFHNPLFPYYNSFFHSPYLAPGNFMEDAIRMHLPKNLTSALLYPFYGLHKNGQLQALPLVDRRFAAFIVLGILCAAQVIMKKMQVIPSHEPLLNKRNKRENSSLIRFLLIFLVVSHITWLLKFAVYRYTIPISFLAGIFIIYFCVRLVPRTPTFQLSACLLLTALLIFTTVQSQWGRIAYGKSFVLVEPPHLPADSLIICMNYFSPVAYLIPYFPSSIRFIGFYNHIVTPPNTLLYQQALNTILQHQGPLYAFTDEGFRESSNKRLSQYGLRITDQCLSIKTNMEYQPIPLCVVTRT